jgi:hypothetical protein
MTMMMMRRAHHATAAALEDIYVAPAHRLIPACKVMSLAVPLAVAAWAGPPAEWADGSLLPTGA